MTMLSGKRSESELAFSEIYARHSQSLYAYCQKVMEFSEEADDVFQDTFYKFIESYKENSVVTNIKGMLIRIARNKCLNYKRSSKETIDYDDLILTSEQDNSLENEELLDLVDMAIKTLEFEYREVFVLRNYQGLSYIEISAILGVNLTTVRNRLYRAKEKIKNLLQPYLEELKQ